MIKTNNMAATTKISRRSVVSSIPLLGLGLGLGQTTGVFAQANPALRIKKINTFEIRVSDPVRSIAFYQDLFGMPVQSRFGGRTCLQVGSGPQFMAVRALLPGETPAITHIGYSVENFNVSSQQAALLQQGYKTIDAPALSIAGIENAMSTWVRMREATPELYFADPRGLIVQLSDESYCGGSGPMGAICTQPEATTAGIFELDDISHFTAFVNDGAGANTYYQQLFGLSVQAHQGPTGPVTGIGDGKQFVMYAGGPSPAGTKTAANLHHGCFNMTGFDVATVLGKLTSYGLKDKGDQPVGPLMHYVSLRQPERGGAVGGTPELYFTDPDGILMQLQDISYCGGGGVLGNECLQG